MQKMEILNQEIDFFSLIDIKVLEKLCEELKNGKLQSFNRPKKSKDAKMVVVLPALVSRNTISLFCTHS